MGKYSLKKPEKMPISEESAHSQVMLLLERNNFDIDIIEKDKQPAVETAIDAIALAVRQGWFEITEQVDGSIIVKQNIQHKSEGSTVDYLEYGEVTGQAHIDMDDSGSRLNQSLSLLTKICITNAGGEIIKKLRSADLSRAEAISLIFL